MSAATKAATELARAALSAAAERERIADAVLKKAMREWKDAKAHHRAARATYDAALAADQFDQANPGLFDLDRSDQQ